MIHARGALVAGLLCAVVPVTSLTQSVAVSLTEFIGFRFDDTHVIAVVKVLDDAGPPQRDRMTSAMPAAQFGFPYFEAPPELAAQVPATLQSARWLIHVAPGQVVDATAEKVVAGVPNCLAAVGVLLTVAPEQAQHFARASARYFVAEAQTPPRSTVDAPRSVVRSLSTPVFGDAQKLALESVLQDLLKRELPTIRAEAAHDIDRIATADSAGNRSWVAHMRRIDRQLLEGRVKLTYDVQAFQLDPSGTPIYFVRAEWLAGRDQAFATSLWLRGDRFEIVEANTAPASWLRMFEFQGQIDRLQLGLVLNVLDRDRDGWGEIVFARGGYESLGVGVREWSPKGFVESAISYDTGC